MEEELELTKIDGYDDCIIGIVEKFNDPPIYCYDKKKIIEKIMLSDGMSFEEAFEHFSYNIIGAWVGKTTPCFLTCHVHDLEG